MSKEWEAPVAFSPVNGATREGAARSGCPMGAGDDERSLLQRLRCGDEEAFEQFVRAHQEQVYRLALRTLGDPFEAEDVAQEVFVTVFVQIERFRGQSRLSTWLYRVAVNHCLNRLRYLRRRGLGRRTSLHEEGGASALQEASTHGAPTLGGRPPRPDEWAEGLELERHLHRALQALNDEHRLLVVLRDLEGMSYEQITEITGLPLGTVKSRLHRARLALVQALQRLRNPGPEGSDG